MIRKLLILAAIGLAAVATALATGASNASAAPIIVLPTLAQPDLVVDSVTTPYYYDQYTTVTLKNVAASSGLSMGAGPFVVRVSTWSYTECFMFCSQPSGWHLDPYSTLQFTVPSLAAGATVTYKVFPATQYPDRVKVEIDPLNQVTERNENNNTYFDTPTYTY